MPCLTLFEAMTSALVKLTVSPLPRPPPPHEEWSLSRPIYLKAYNTILEAGDHASEQVKANPFSEEAKDNAMHARVIGYLLLEVFNRRAILTEGPCASIAKQIESASREGLTAHDIVFGIGKWYFDCLLHTCMFDFFPSFGVSVSPQIGQPLGSTQYPPWTLQVNPSRHWRR